MFGQEPRLPVDFLLGRVQDPVPGEVQDWVAEHRARLKVAFEGAHGRLLAAAGRRKERHDQRVRDAPLPVGQLVYLRDHGVRGRHKIQDLWNSMVHQVVRAPADEGAVYTVAPVDDLDRTRKVHRDMLKAVVHPEAVAFPPPAPSSPVLLPLAASVDDSPSSDLWFLVPETPVLPTAVLPLAASRDASSAPIVMPHQAVSRSATPLDHGDSSQPAPTLSPADQPSTSQQSLRRTNRPTAGSHPNVHHLPRPAGPQGHAANRPPDPASNSQVAVFRPWC